MENEAWSLEAFVDSLVVELDKTRETLAVKSINKPLFQRRGTRQRQPSQDSCIQAEGDGGHSGQDGNS